MNQNNLNKFKLNLKSKLRLNAKSIEKEDIDQILKNQYFYELIELVLLQIDEDDAGSNVIKILDYCFKQGPLLENLYPKLSTTKSKYILIDYLIENLNDKEFSIVKEDLNYLINLFRNCLNKLFDEKNETDKIELVKLSDLMCLLSANFEFDKSLINKDLISLLIEKLLHCHTIGKQEQTSDDNPFKIISKLKNVNDPNMNKETFFGFKSNLIGLLGNFAHSNKDIQDIIRELDGISLILDCTNIDARNPFIIQWSIFALKNILSDNKENQEFVRNVSKKDGPLKIDLSKIF